MTPTPHPDHQQHVDQLPTRTHDQPADPRHRYSRADTIADGLLIEVPIRLSRQFGISWPLALSTLAWFDAVAWDAATEAAKPRPTGQTESGRIAEVLWAAHQAITTNPTNPRPLTFTAWRVPPTGRETRSVRCTLTLTVHTGDRGETVATIHHPQVPHAGRFTIPRFCGPDARFSATGYDQDPDGMRWPVVTPDTLDAILTEAAHHTRTAHARGAGAAVHIDAPHGHPVTLRPDRDGRYHLRPLGWSCLYLQPPPPARTCHPTPHTPARTETR